MKRLLKNKKGIISLDSIGNTIRSVIDIMPTWLKFLILLFLLATIGYVISYAFNVFGIYCNSANEPVKVANMFTGLSLIFEKPDSSLLGKTTIETKEVLWVEECSILAEQGGTFRFDQEGDQDLTGLNPNSQDGLTYEIDNTMYLYLSPACTNCRTGWYKPNNSNNLPRRTCFGNVEAIPDGKKTFGQQVSCVLNGCEPPKNYEFDTKTNNYRCIDESCKSKTQGDNWDALLKSKQAELLYPNTNNKRNTGADGFIGITCTDINPKLAIFGFDFLNYKIMLLGLVLAVLIWIATKL